METEIIKSCLVRIWKEEAVIGTAFLISEDWIITCAHVIEYANKDFIDDKSSGPGKKQVEVDFAFIQPGKKLLAEVIYINNNQDIAGLKLLEEIPERAQPANLLKTDNYWKHPFTTCGFASYDGNWVVGIINEEVSSGDVQLESKADGSYLIEQGFSGAPIWDDKLHGVVGMISVVDFSSQNHTASRMITFEKILNEWPEINDFVEQAVSLSPVIINQLGISPNETLRIKETFEKPNNFLKASKLLEKETFILIRGVAGIGKRTLALYLSLLKDQSSYILVIQRLDLLRDVLNTGITGCTLVCPDAFGTNRLEYVDLEEKFRQIEILIKQGNRFVLTTDNRIWDDVQREVRIPDWIAKNQLIFSEDAYSKETKVNILLKTATYACNHLKLLSDKQMNWLSELTQEQVDKTLIFSTETKQQFTSRLNKWLPLDIERFIFNTLPGVKNSQEIKNVLYEDSFTEAQIHEWFTNLDPSIQCFIFALCIFTRFPEEEFWKYYKIITSKIKVLDPNLAVIPLGIARKRSSPYVTSRGLLDFISQETYKLVVREIVTNYREYIIELQQLWKELSVPAIEDRSSIGIDLEEKKERNNRVIEETENTRNAIAVFIGEAAKQKVIDIQSVIETWADHNFARVSKTAGITLSRMAESYDGSQLVQEIINKWTNDYDNEKRRSAAASALWRLVNPRSLVPTDTFILPILQKLALDFHPDVFGSAAHSSRMMCHAVPLEELIPIWRTISRKRTSYARQQVAFGIDELAKNKRETVISLIGEWLNSKSRYTRWTAVYTLVFGKNIPGITHNKLLKNVIETDAEIFVSVVQSEIDQNPLNFANSLVTIFNKSSELKNALSSCLIKLEVNKPLPTFWKEWRTVIGNRSNELCEILDEINRKVFAYYFYNDFTYFLSVIPGLLEEDIYSECLVISELQEKTLTAADNEIINSSILALYQKDQEKFFSFFQALFETDNSLANTLFITFSKYLFSTGNSQILLGILGNESSKKKDIKGLIIAYILELAELDEGVLETTLFGISEDPSIIIKTIWDNTRTYDIDLANTIVLKLVRVEVSQIINNSIASLDAISTFLNKLWGWTNSANDSELAKLYKDAFHLLIKTASKDELENIRTLLKRAGDYRVNNLYALRFLFGSSWGVISERVIFSQIQAN